MAWQGSFKGRSKAGIEGVEMIKVKVRRHKEVASSVLVNELPPVPVAEISLQGAQKGTTPVSNMISSFVLADRSKKEATRAAFGSALLELMNVNNNIVVLCADLEESLNVTEIHKKYPARFFEMGVAEQNMVTTAVGLSTTGLVPWATTFGAFVPFRTLDQIRINLGYGKANVKLASSHCGLLTGEDGATHQPLEDIAVLRPIPNMTVVVPCDATETKKAVIVLSNLVGPSYLRLSRAKTLVLTTADAPFEIGKALQLKDGSDVTLIACGSMVSKALEASESLEKEGVNARVLNIHTIKPLDILAIIKAARETGCIVVAEEHQLHGGLGGAVAETLSTKFPVPMEQVAVKDSFGESGEGEALMVKYGLTPQAILEAARRAIKRKNKEF
ncbi:MAG: transketolase C-terminal domain-containing protein [Candidatus Woesearchaeota archaeon]